MLKVKKLAACLVVAATVTAGALISTDTRGQDKAAQPDMNAMMKAWKSAMTPGKEHAMLASQVGKWKVEMIDYSMGETKTDATAEIKMLMGGRYQEVKISGSMMGQPFEGCSTTGFDNVRKIYNSTWIDNMGTSITSADGKATDDQTVEFKGQMVEPMSSKMLDFRSVIKHVDDDHFTYEIFFTAKGKETKMMTSNYTRDK